MLYTYANMADISVLYEFFTGVDADKDGFVTIDEIKQACQVDIDGNGVITEDEKLQCARVWINEKMPLQDLDGDAKLSFAEMVSFNQSAT